MIVFVASAATAVIGGGCRPLPRLPLETRQPASDAGADNADSAPDQARATIDAVADVPDVPPTLGDVTIQWADASPIQLPAGAAMLFRFNIQSTAPNRTTLALTPRLSVPGWKTSLFDSNLYPLPASGITVDPQVSTEFWLRVDPGPDQLGQTFQLAIDAMAPSLSGSTGWLDFTVGQTPTTPDRSITIVPYVPDLGPGSMFDGATITATSGALASFTFKYVFITGGDGFSLAVNQVGGASGWGTFFTSGLPIQIAPNTIRALGFGIGMGATVGTNGYIRMDVRQNGTVVRTILAAIEVAPSP